MQVSRLVLMSLQRMPSSQSAPASWSQNVLAETVTGVPMGQVSAPASEVPPSLELPASNALPASDESWFLEQPTAKAARESRTRNPRIRELDHIQRQPRSPRGRIPTRGTRTAGATLAEAMDHTLNPSVKANLEIVIDEVRAAAALRLAWVRAVAGVLATLILFLSPTSEAIAPSRVGALVFLGVSLCILAAVHFQPRLRTWASLSVAFIDVPVVAASQYAQSLSLGEPWHVISPNVAVMCLLVALSMLSLSRPVILLTAAMATPSVIFMALRAGLPWPPLLLSGAVPFCIAAVGLGLVSRIRALVQAARKKDLLGKYVLGDRLGVGGMAEVFLATYCPEGGFERKVAIKRMLPSIADERDAVALFRREAELGAALAHPNIVQVLDFGADVGSYFMAMEYVDGVPFSRLLNVAAHGIELLPFPAVVTVAIRLAEALDYLHTRKSPDGTPMGLVHRDLNPPNILVSNIGDVKLSDLGIARGALNTQLTQAGVMRGKLSYSPPEQILAQPLDGRVDLFALGVTLHEALTAQKLFRGRDETDLVKLALSSPIPPPSSLRPDVPPELERVVMQLLERERDQRTPSAHVLLEALRALPPALRDPDVGRSQLAAWVARARTAPTGPASRPTHASLVTGPALEETVTSRAATR